MTVFAYAYTDPLLGSPPDAAIWETGVDRIYQDLGDRHQLHQLLQDCREMQATPGGEQVTVRVRHFAELGDSVQAVGDRLAELADLGITVVAIAHPGQTEDEAGGKVGELPSHQSDWLQLYQGVQQQQRQRLLQRGHAKNRVKALPPPGKAPYGYRRGKDRYALDRSTAPIVKDFFDHFLLYGSLRGSVRYLARKYNKTISVSTGKRWLTSPVYRGDLAYHTGDVLSDTHVPILSRDEAAQVDRLLRRNRALPPRTATAPRSLAGLVTCAHCGSAMTVTHVTARGGQQDYLYLRPVACPYPARSQKKQAADTNLTDSVPRHRCRALPYDTVLRAVIAAICRDLPRAVAGTELPDIERVQQSLEAQIEAKQAALAQLSQLEADGVLDEETATLRAYTLRAEVSSLQATLAQLPPVNLGAIAQTVSIPQFWLDLSEAERRFYFREFIREIRLVRHFSSADPSGSDRHHSLNHSPKGSQDWTIELGFRF
ncbi:MAG: recombinase family protein [Synechococcales bacterium]|nr:recombinase family protein [Synechococcales bacterium]